MAVFGKGQPKKTFKTIISEIVNRTNDNTMRLRRIEQSAQSINMRMDSIEQNFLEERKNIEKGIAEIKDLLSSHERKITETEKNLQEIVEHIKKMPKNEKLAELEQLVEIYNPLKSNFVTKEEAKKMLEERKV
ncbi:MAG: hypothetical protein ISS36_03485 [Candidatus Aenigmarchaeota archaeon]|nr:hypothetical protein [Candidatus Aenigmarchaeota archaeon]